MPKLTNNTNNWTNVISIIGIFVLVTIAIVAIAIYWAKQTSLVKGTSAQKIVYLDEFPYLEKTDSISVMTWNISYAFGVGSEGTDSYHQLTKEDYQNRFSQLLEVIKQQDPDILLLQEIDFDSRRTHFQDQALAIAKALGYHSIAYATSWDLNFVPFPYSLKNYFGKIVSGGAILSKFKIEQNEVTLFDRPQANPFWYNWFYLYRYGQVVTVNINGSKYDLINTHLEAFDKTARLDQVKQIKFISENNNRLLFLGGDFNTTPTTAIHKNHFEGYPEDDYHQDGAYAGLQSLKGIRDSVSLEEYSANESNWFTFPATGPDRKLDYIFVSEQMEIESKQILKTMASDHLPIVIKAKFNQL